MTVTRSEIAEAFDAGFDGPFTAVGEAGYDQARAVWNGAIDGRPAVVAHCRGVSDVVAAVNLTRAGGLPLAVRAGGHSVAGFSSCDDGVVIDLRAMNMVTVDPVRR